jgi:type IV secretory pathway TrbF-like protein
MRSRLRKIFSQLFPANDALFKENIPLDTNNPYVAARREWSFMFGDILKAKYNWQCISFLLGLINIALVLGLIIVALQARFVPYAVKVDNLGNADFAGFLSKQNEISPLMINAMLRRYIVEARSVIADPVAQKHQLDFVYRCTLGEGKAVLDNFYKSQNPFDVAKNETIDAAINSVLPISSNTWQVHWTEIHRDSSGHVSMQSHFESLVTISHKTPSSMDDININPLGLYVTHLSWAVQQ